MTEAPYLPKHKQVRTGKPSSTAISHYFSEPSPVKLLERDFFISPLLSSCHLELCSKLQIFCGAFLRGLHWHYDINIQAKVRPAPKAIATLSYYHCLFAWSSSVLQEFGQSNRLTQLFLIAWGAALRLIFYSLWAGPGGPGQELYKFGQVFCSNVDDGSPCSMSWVDQDDISTQRE